MPNPTEEERGMAVTEAGNDEDLRRKLEDAPSVSDSEFCFHSKASVPLKVTCYGSSSAKTPTRYLDEARLLGYVLAKRGHVCINGAGSFGCMAAMNEGCHLGNGHVRGVIHEMFLVDNGYLDNAESNAETSSRTSSTKVFQKRGSTLPRVFENATLLASGENSLVEEAAPHDKTITPIREIYVAGGDDLQERKRILVVDTDALIVLPGGPGTWDELWEMACAKHLELNSLPIVCVNIDGYYEPFREILHRAYRDKLIRHPPNKIVRFADSAQEAIRFVEQVGGESKEDEEDNNRVEQGDRLSSLVHRGGLAVPFLMGTMFGLALSIAGGFRRQRT